MIYLGQPAGYKGYCFYRITNGRIFIGATTVFDETYFLRCSDGKQRLFTELGDEPPTENVLWNSLLSLILSYQPCLSYLIK